MSANTPGNPQRLDNMGNLDTPPQSLLTPLTFENAATDAINFTQGPLGPFSQADMGDPATVDLEDEWSRIHAEENLLQALVNFDANPNFFTLPNLVPM
jgi:hypothetical protein